MTAPFDYPADPHTRCHGPLGYRDCDSFRPWLRDEFSFRCVYCLLREQWGRVRGLYTIDHFLPVSRHPAQSVEYDNLLYACVTCNGAKGDRTLPDPLAVLTRPGVRVAEDGTIHADNPEAARLIELLGLNAAESVEFRLLWIGILALCARHDPPLYRRLLGYPDDLPDLTRLIPPAGNQRPQGVTQSAHARRSRGQLSDVY
ncbi:MAG: HNH endonuclease [Gemmataceae bacterium]